MNRLGRIWDATRDERCAPARLRSIFGSVAHAEALVDHLLGDAEQPLDDLVAVAAMGDLEALVMHREESYLVVVRGDPRGGGSACAATLAEVLGASAPAGTVSVINAWGHARAPAHVTTWSALVAERHEHTMQSVACLLPQRACVVAYDPAFDLHRDGDVIARAVAGVVGISLLELPRPTAPTMGAVPCYPPHIVPPGFPTDAGGGACYGVAYRAWWT